VDQRGVARSIFALSVMRKLVEDTLRVGAITLVIPANMAHMWAVVVQIICVAFVSLEMTKFRCMYGVATLMISFFSAVGIGVLRQEVQPQPVWLWVLTLLPVGLLAILGLLRLVDPK
jgi:hypothetical protein